ncbi:MAG: DUF1501 domain-containing protein [Acidobacteria bacterium]|nr:DUF1501 domain-containing protein [Acidobacteriota bacterium]
MSIEATRRQFLTRSGFGFPALACSWLLARDQAAAAVPANPLAAKPPHFEARAKSVILIFLQGGASHVDTFDPKPVLAKLDGQTVPPSFKPENLNLQFIQAAEAKLMASSFPFRPYGKSGLQISDLFRNLAQHADDLAIVRSCYHESFVHGPALNLLYNGSLLVGHPSVGSWVVYGLGNESDSLPAFMVMTDGSVSGRNTKSFSSGFLPAIYQGTLARTEGSPIMNLAPPPYIERAEQRVMLDQLKDWNNQHAGTRPDDSRLAARIANYELAFRMQMAAPELIDISGEPGHVRALYGLDDEATAKFGRICLLARRMVERGVRFVQLISTDWDGHAQCDQNHLENSRKIDRPIAGLIADLKQRGLLESTLLVSTGEFGRTPIMQGVRGRDHHPYAFSVWMAGGGIRGGKSLGATDELGFRPAVDPFHVHDVHATLLSLLGLDHTKLTWFFQGRSRRLTDVGGDRDFSRKLLEA